MNRATNLHIRHQLNPKSQNPFFVCILYIYHTYEYDKENIYDILKLHHKVYPSPTWPTQQRKPLSCLLSSLHFDNDILLFLF